MPEFLDTAISTRERWTDEQLQEELYIMERRIADSTVPYGSDTLCRAACLILLVRRKVITMSDGMSKDELREEAVQAAIDEYRNLVEEGTLEESDVVWTDPDSVLEWLEGEGDEFCEDELSANQRRLFAKDWKNSKTLIDNELNVVDTTGGTMEQQTIENTNVAPTVVGPDGQVAKAKGPQAPRGPMSPESKQTLAEKLREHYKANPHPMTGKQYSDEAKANMKKGQQEYWRKRREAEAAAKAAAAPETATETDTTETTEVAEETVE